MASEEVLVFLRAQIGEFSAKMREAGHEVDQVGNRGDQLGQKYAALGGKLLLGVGAAAVAVGVYGVEMADRFEGAHARLENAVEHTGAKFEDLSGKVSDTDDRMESLGFTNAETENSLARLVTATGNVEKSTKLMSLAADIARARHIDLQAATDILVKVEAGRYTVLGRTLGISKDVVAGIKNQDDAIKLLSDRYGGAAQKNAETFAGKMQVLQARAEDIAKDIGLLLIPVIEELAGALADGLHWFEDNKEIAAALGAVIAAVLVPAMALFVAQKVSAAAAAIAASWGRMLELGGQLAGVLTGSATATAEAAAAEAALAESYTVAAAAEQELTTTAAAHAAADEALTATAAAHATANEELAASYAVLSGASDELTISSGGLAASSDDLAASYAVLSGATEEVTVAASTQAAANDELVASYLAMTGSQADLEVSYAALSGFQDEATIAAQAQSAANLELAASYEALTAAEGEAGGGAAVAGSGLLAAAGAATAFVLPAALIGQSLIGSEEHFRSSTEEGRKWADQAHAGAASADLIQSKVEGLRSEIAQLEQKQREAQGFGNNLSFGDAEKLAKLQAQLKGYNSELDNHKTKALGAADVTNNLQNAQALLADAISRYGPSSKEAAAAQDIFNAAQARSKELEDQVTQATKDQTKALQDLQNQSLGVAGAEQSFHQAQQANADAQLKRLAAQIAYNNAVRDYGPASTQAAQAQAALNDAQAGAQSANLTLTNSTLALEDQYAKLEDQVKNGNTGAVDALIAKFRGEERLHPEIAASIDPLIAKLEALKLKYADIPPEVNTHVNINIDTSTIDAALARLHELQAEGESTTTTFGIPVGGPGGIRRFAEGGDAYAGKLAMFGEHGPELGVPLQDLHIFTAAQTKAFLTPKTATIAARIPTPAQPAVAPPGPAIAAPPIVVRIPPVPIPAGVATRAPAVPARVPVAAAALPARAPRGGDTITFQRGAIEIHPAPGVKVGPEIVDQIDSALARKRKNNGGTLALDGRR